jgi:glycosyltransferase involved in cell wall biosynthesis
LELGAKILTALLREPIAVPAQVQEVLSEVEEVVARPSYSKVSIIIPAYNEGERLVSRLQSVERLLGSTVRVGAYELIVVTDGSSSATFEIAQRYGQQLPSLKAIHFPKRLGKGGAIIQALGIATGDPVVLLDADDSVPPESVLSLIEATEHCDLAIGSRYVKEARLLVREPFLRFWLGRAFNAYARFMFRSLRGIRDTQCGAKAVRRRVIERIREDLFITDFVFDLNLIVSTIHHAFVVKEIGIEWEHVEKGSKVSVALVRFVLLMGFSLVRLRIYYSKFRRLLQADGIDRLACFLWKFAMTREKA